MSVLVSMGGVVGEWCEEDSNTKPGVITIPPLDRGLLYGHALFETILVNGGRLILPRAHLDRLLENAPRLGFSVPWSVEQLLFEMENLVALRSIPWGYLRILITAGSGEGLWPGKQHQSQPRKILYYGARDEDANVSPKLAKSQSIHPGQEVSGGLKLRRKIAYHYSHEPRIKTNSYVHEIVALKQATQEGFHDILWTREDGEILEASTANIFFMARHGDLLEVATPPLSSGILPGITRKKVIELLHHAGIPVTEQKIYFDEMPRFDEGFLTSSIAGLRPLGQIDRQRLHTLRPQASFWHFQRLYQTWLETHQYETSMVPNS